ncbi:hypothetical protein ASZ78_003568 [Callipepla squamata]|uniref:Uncharacterized protein n=1 Tax=Callipepla squamata TaxID=9009 RepID=A0A226MEL9_CALSU|nr:hypothetical protein ASZ78_003568 [Callipepla squamata]
MLVLLAGIFVVHIATVIMLFVSTIANVWMVGSDGVGNFSWGLWLQCNGTCTPLSVNSGDERLCILIGVSIYTARFTGSLPGLTSSHHGYSFILAWICFCFSFVIGILYLVLRKK